MKELYEELELEVIRFKTEDIITTSAETTEQTTNVDDYTPWGSGTLQWGTEASSTAPIYVKTVDGTEQFFVKQGDTYVRVHQGEDGIWHRDA